ncbi:hypothetical protein ATX70_09165 [Oenococcus oeni]|uniref:hypothetical protein n=1 Tax=Oenococcus oeni TaxID=1247 RepID=UPI0008F841EC|nr:hypothetical protein [Oenococcus oeni]OIM34784.1 hypothetical protein ATX70_09165 [Oenococcus oeni]
MKKWVKKTFIWILKSVTVLSLLSLLFSFYQIKRNYVQDRLDNFIQATFEQEAYTNVYSYEFSHPTEQSKQEYLKTLGEYRESLNKVRLFEDKRNPFGKKIEKSINNQAKNAGIELYNTSSYDYDYASGQVSKFNRKNDLKVLSDKQMNQKIKKYSKNELRFLNIIFR